MTADPLAYLAEILDPRAPQPGAAPADDRTITALRALCQHDHVQRHGTTEGMIAGESGLSYARTQRDILWLVAAGQVEELKGSKTDGFISRYRIAVTRIEEAP